MAALDLTGVQFGLLTAVRRTSLRGERKTRWECVCECGATSVVRSDDLASGHTRSCGCLRSETSMPFTNLLNSDDASIVCFYHCWLGGAWEEPWEEFRETLIQGGFPGRVHRVRVRYGWENETLDRVRAYALQSDGAVLYAHTKGAFHLTDFNDRWRRSMTAQVAGRWRDNLKALEDHDLVGCHWITPNMVPAGSGPEFRDGLSFFGGNFWMARCDYLRTLPPCPSETRHQAERWVGMGNPRVLDLVPGWPDDSLWPELCAA